MRATLELFGKPLTGELTVLDHGLDAALLGGDRGHIGAVCLADENGPLLLERHGHREGELAKSWALRLFEATGLPVSVRCGVHYDRFSKEMLPAIYGACDTLLQDLISQYERSDSP